MISNHLDGYEQTSQRMLITRTFSMSVLRFPEPSRFPTLSRRSFLTKAFSPSLYIRVGWPYDRSHLLLFSA